MLRMFLLIILFKSLLFPFHEYENKKNDSKSIIDKSLDNVELKLKYVYDKLNISSKYIDEFLTNEKDDLVYTHSYIRLEQDITKEESKDLDSNSNLDVRIYLPKLKKKLSLNINNNDNIINQDYEDSNEKSYNDDNKYNIGFIYNTLKDTIDLNLKLGMKFSSTPYLYSQAEVSKDIDLNSKNSILFKEKIRYSKKKELDNYSVIEYKYLYTNKLNFTNYNEYYINNEIKNDNLYNSFRLFYELSNSKYINYVTSIDSNDKYSNFKIKEYKTYISYRSYIRKWLYYDLVPSITWEDENDFNTNLGFKFNLGIIIKR